MQEQPPRGPAKRRPRSNGDRRDQPRLCRLCHHCGGDAQLVAGMRGKGIVSHHAPCPFSRQIGSWAPSLIDPLQLGRLGGDRCRFRIGLRAERDLFARRHRHGARNHRRALVMRGGCHVDDRAGVGNDAIVGTRLRLPQPADARHQMPRDLRRDRFRLERPPDTSPRCGAGTTGSTAGHSARSKPGRSVPARGFSRWTSGAPSRPPPSPLR